MQIESRWIFDCDPEHIWPCFLSATMDDHRPLMFRMGIPKPVSCRLLDTDLAVGAIRQCTTERGTSDQAILDFQENRRLHYRMVNSSMPLGHWIGKLEDTFTLTPLGGRRTAVGRRTVFTAKSPVAFFKQIGIAVFLKQTHNYAARNWRRLSYERAGHPVIFPAARSTSKLSEVLG